jgi:hypothetical protein
MNDDEIKAAAGRVFDVLLKGCTYESRIPEYAEAAACLTKVFRHYYIELIEKAIRGDAKVREPEYNPVTGEELEEGCFMMAHNTPDGLCDPITGCPGCAQERRRRESRDGCK